MKGFLKSGKVKVWAVGDQYAIEMALDASVEELAGRGRRGGIVG